MALQKTWDTGELGVTLTDAYIKVTGVTVSKDKGVLVRVGIAADQAAATNKRFVESKTYRYDYTTTVAVDPIAHGYNLIKTESEMSGAIDI